MLIVRNPPANAGDAGDVGSIPGLARSPGRGNAKPLQYSCLENLMNRGAWWATVHGVAKNTHTQNYNNNLKLKSRPKCLLGLALKRPEDGYP